MNEPSASNQFQPDETSPLAPDLPGEGKTSEISAFGRVPWPTHDEKTDYLAGVPAEGSPAPAAPPPPTPAAPPPPAASPLAAGAHRAPPPGDVESTSVVDRGWLNEQIGKMDQERAGTAAPYAGSPAPVKGQPRQFEAQTVEHLARRGEPAHGAQGWPPPAAPTQAWPQGQPERAASADWSAAQGSGASWNYVDNIRSSELVPTRRIPPTRGWRKVLYRATFKLLNPGQSADERYEAELVAKARSLLRGTYKIGVLGKGGAGKSTVAAGVGSVFAELRKDDRVVAVDADTAFGKLGARVDPSASGSYWELAADRNLHTFADMRARVGSNSAGLFVLAGPSETARRRILDPAIYRAATEQLNRHFTLSIIDCGSTMDSVVTHEVLNDLDALIVVSSPWFDGASAAGQTLEWLAHNGYTGLLHRTVVVVNDSDGHADKGDLKLLVERFGRHGQKVIQMPYDQHLRPGGVVDVVNEISPLTRRRLLELAAECAEHFAATSDRPVRPGSPPQPAPHPGQL